MLRPERAPAGAWSRAALAAAVAALAGCKQDQNFAELTIESTVVVTGDFDRLEEPLLRADVKNQLFDGYIVQPVYESSSADAAGGQQVEALFSSTDAEGLPILYEYDALFLNSGARGFGAYVYNDVEPDDQLVTDPDVLALVKDFTERSRVLVVSDWGYDLIEANWPDRITFLNEDEGTDAAQLGISDSVIATITDPNLADVLGANQVELNFDFGYWTVMESVANGVEVHMRGDVQWRSPDGGAEQRLEDVPLLVSFDAGSGRVVYSSFAWRAQHNDLADALLATMVDGLRVQRTETRREESGGSQ